MIHLLFAVHNHQPVGNFDFIFERAYDRAYKPFLDVLEKHPGVRISIHFSGILLDWLEKNRPEYLRAVRALREAGRVEVLGGGYYEPILPMLTESDRRGQVEALSARIESLFGARPRGMWLAERVWEPSLVSSIADAGIEYVVLDGSHFKMVGKGDADLEGWFETEDQGRRLKLLPIHDAVRDTIPFRTVEEVIARLRGMNDAANGRRVQVVFGDDGEKFGDWPDTYDSVYGQGWLDRFFAAMESEPEVFAIRPLREGIDLGAGQGLVYLPPASYGEMMAWAQDARDLPGFRDLRRFLWDAGRGEESERFVRGTFWRNFLAKYPESNRMHKQALRLSLAIGRLEAAGKISSGAAREARHHVWQSQCNCAYWHGVFGGLYLPHLRFAIYRHLIAAQSVLAAAGEAPEWEASDWNFDGREEHLLDAPGLFAAFTADGAIDQLWLKRTGLNLSDTLTRRREAYHTRVAHLADGSEGGTKLEDQIAAKESGLESYLVYDKRTRENFAEWLLPPGLPFEQYRVQDFSPLAVPVFGAPAFKKTAKGREVRFTGTAATAEEGVLDVVKVFSLTSSSNNGPVIEVKWDVTARDKAASFRFVSESLFCLLAGNAPDRYLSWGTPGGDPGEGRDILASRGQMPGASRIAVTDEWLGFRAEVSASGSLPPAVLWRDAIETVSQSEGGYERVYQGTVIAPVWDVELSPGDSAAFALRVAMEERALEEWKG
ncbi:MAG TPA: alpha-amylase/4-alpha-glucanotransferase domain-containing protein [Fibrobacteria bacterium]|nr:alpha-amylase/4-alpha-glucanotransferase domain-containing protein [Fibrobacteria bacterium]